MTRILNVLKAILLLIPMLLIGAVAFVIAIPAMLTGQHWKWLNQVFLKPFGIAARTIIGVRLTLLNPEKAFARRPAVLFGNHQSGLDLAIIGTACTPGTIVVGKKEIAQIPILGWWWRAAGNLFIDRSNPKAARESLMTVAKIVHERHLNVAIFPEGTRNTGKQPGLLPFKKGGFHLARELKVPIIPIVCSSMRHRAIWETFELSGGHVVVSVLDPIETTDWSEANLNEKIEFVQGLMSAEFERISALAAAKENR